MSITIKDIAKKAGVSPSTVSRTINNHYSISEETKEKVRKVMDELGYVYDKSHIKKHDVGVVFPRSIVIPVGASNTFLHFFLSRLITFKLAYAGNIS